jgi:AraC family transcriptional regulator of adaptative response/methylated-DNA-[protein]-cysteine methyltransferase
MTNAASTPALYVSEENRREAIRARDRAADGAFWYGVKTTGVYCRPWCPARPARPENIVFAASQAEAVAAGFRPCKRCKPDLAKSGSA